MNENKDTLINDFDKYIQTKRQDSFNQFKSRWESIINRYSKPILNDDVIDLFTGEIIEDHGFIKSVKTLPFGSMVNAMDDEEKKKERNLSSKKVGNKEEDFTYEEDDFDNLLSPQKQTLLQIVAQRSSRKRIKLSKDDEENFGQETKTNNSESNSVNNFDVNSNILSPMLDNNHSKQDVFDSIIEMGFNTNNEFVNNEDVDDELDLFSEMDIPYVDFDKYNSDNELYELTENEDNIQLLEDINNNNNDDIIYINNDNDTNINTINNDTNSNTINNDTSFNTNFKISNNDINTNTNGGVDIKSKKSDNLVIISDDNTDTDEIFAPINTRKRKRNYDDYISIVDEEENLKPKDIIKVNNDSYDDVEILNIIKEEIKNKIKSNDKEEGPVNMVKIENDSENERKNESDSENESDILIENENESENENEDENEIGNNSIQGVFGEEEFKRNSDNDYDIFKKNNNNNNGDVNNNEGNNENISLIIKHKHETEKSRKNKKKESDKSVKENKHESKKTKKNKKNKGEKSGTEKDKQESRKIKKDKKKKRDKSIEENKLESKKLDSDEEKEAKKKKRIKIKKESKKKNKKNGNNDNESTKNEEEVKEDAEVSKNKNKKKQDKKNKKSFEDVIEKQNNKEKREKKGEKKKAK